jgi:hypothetical protein
LLQVPNVDSAKHISQSTASKLRKRRLPGDDGGMAKGRYWDGPEGAHRSYCVAVEELFMKFMGDRKIVPETMTPDQARDLLKEIRESDDPRIRDFNRTMRMLASHFGFGAGQAAGPDNIVARAHQLVWRSLHDKATEVLDAFGKKDCLGHADYWMVDDDWGLDFIRVEVQNLQLLRLVVVGKLKQILGDFPGWHIAVRVDVPGKEKTWPLMGILIFRGRVIDHLKREYLPGEFRWITYEDL